MSAADNFVSASVRDGLRLGGGQLSAVGTAVFSIDFLRKLEKIVGLAPRGRRPGEFIVSI